MLDAFSYASLAPADRPARAARASIVPHGLLAGVLSMFLFYSAALGAFHRVIVPLFVVFFLIWATLSQEYRPAARAAALKYWAVALYLVLVLVLGRLLEVSLGTEGAITFQRVFALYPLAAATGWLLVSTGRLRQYYSWMLGVGLLTLPAAYYEYLANTSLLNNHSYARNGQSRAVVGAEHPLVLGTLFLGLMPVAIFVLRRWQRTACVLLLLGIISTGSNGPIAIGAVVAVLCLVPRVSRLVLSSRRPLLCFLAVLVGYLAYGAAFLWSSEINGTTTSEISNQYRASLYWLLPRMLIHHPFGFGFGGFPAGTYFFNTSVAQIVDVKHSIDSEVVYSCAEFGILALIVFLAICLVSADAAVKHQAMGLSTMSVTLAGFFLALHSWESMGSFWFLGVGACIAVAYGSGEGTRWQGLCRYPQKAVSHSATADQGT